MKNRTKIILTGYIVTLIAWLIYSFALTDPNLTLLNHPVWAHFRDTMVNFGYLNRPDSWTVYLLLITALFCFHIAFLKKAPNISPVKLSMLIGGILLFAYPLLSHDFFNYIFDAKILTVYGKNPYQYLPADFADDQWLRFMHWTDRTYPYGPTFLPITILVSYFTFGKFIINYILFKGLFVGTYVGCVWLLQKMKKSWAIFFATSPLVIIEGVINAHNDLIAVFFGLLGILYLVQTSQDTYNIKARIAFLVSGGIKYFSLPTLFLRSPVKKGKQHLHVFAAVLGTLGLVLYLSFTGALQPWYYLNLLIFIPYFFDTIKKFHILMFGLLISYYPIIRFGVWEPDPGVNVKNIIVWAALGINIMYIIAQKALNKSRHT